MTSLSLSEMGTSEKRALLSLLTRLLEHLLIFFNKSPCFLT